MENISKHGKDGSMQNVTYTVIFIGELKEGHNESAVKQSLARIGNISQTDIERIFSGGKIPLKHGLNQETAEFYRQKLDNIGMVVTVTGNTYDTLKGAFINGETNKVISDINIESKKQILCIECGKTKSLWARNYAGIDSSHAKGKKLPGDRSNEYLCMECGSRIEKQLQKELLDSQSVIDDLGKLNKNVKNEKTVCKECGKKKEWFSVNYAGLQYGICKVKIPGDASIEYLCKECGSTIGEKITKRNLRFPTGLYRVWKKEGVEIKKSCGHTVRILSNSKITKRSFY